MACFCWYSRKKTLCETLNWHTHLCSPTPFLFLPHSPMAPSHAYQPPFLFHSLPPPLPPLHHSPVAHSGVYSMVRFPLPSTYHTCSTFKTPPFSIVYGFRASRRCLIALCACVGQEVPFEWVPTIDSTIVVIGLLLVAGRWPFASSLIKCGINWSIHLKKGGVVTEVMGSLTQWLGVVTEIMWLTSWHYAGLEYGHWNYDTIPAVSYMYMYALAASDKFQPLLCGGGFEKGQLGMHWWLLPLLYRVLLGYVPHDAAEIHPLPVAIPFPPHKNHRGSWGFGVHGIPSFSSNL